MAYPLFSTPRILLFRLAIIFTEISVSIFIHDIRWKLFGILTVLELHIGMPVFPESYMSYAGYSISSSSLDHERLYGQ